jgi:hypothetical protein
VWRLRQTRSRASEYSMHAVERDLGNPSAPPGPSLGHSWSAIHLRIGDSEIKTASLMRIHLFDELVHFSADRISEV